MRRANESTRQRRIAGAVGAIDEVVAGTGLPLSWVVKMSAITPMQQLSRWREKSAINRITSASVGVAEAGRAPRD